jgi:predicted nucleic acid-binding protein
MIAVADTSPINYLILIGEIEILTKIYGRVVIPNAVREELQRLSAPEVVRNWTKQPPAWLEVRTPAKSPDSSMSTLDPGERDAIILAEELGADQLIVDDRQGRREAEKRGIAVIGTLGVLREAGSVGHIDLRTALSRLEETSFHIAPEIIERLLKDET